MKKLLVALPFLLMSSSLFALLSPLNQSLKEYETLISSDELTHYLKQGDTIEGIRRLDNSFVIYTNHSQMLVDVVYLPKQRIGPAEFEFTFHEPTLNK